MKKYFILLSFPLLMVGCGTPANKGLGLSFKQDVHVDHAVMDQQTNGTVHVELTNWTSTNSPAMKTASGGAASNILSVITAVLPPIVSAALGAVVPK